MTNPELNQPQGVKPADESPSLGPPARRPLHIEGNGAQTELAGTVERKTHNTTIITLNRCHDKPTAGDADNAWLDVQSLGHRSQYLSGVSLAANALVVCWRDQFGLETQRQRKADLGDKCAPPRSNLVDWAEPLLAMALGLRSRRRQRHQ